MCLIIFAHKAESHFPLVVAANRDEFFSRPTQPAMFWESEVNKQTILAGKDLLAGGTWLGLSKAGRFSAVTNIRDPSQAEPAPRSRGELTLNFLRGTDSAEDYANSLSESFNHYAGFNLLFGDSKDMFYVNNLENLVHKLEPGIYGLSNDLLNSDWPKINRGREDLKSLLNKSNSLTTDQLIKMMNQREISKDENLPCTGVSLEIERALSSTFIMNTNHGYGTRCSTAIIAREDGEFRFSEQNYDDVGQATERHYYQFLKYS